jgi:hypothetical protein
VLDFFFFTLILLGFIAGASFIYVLVTRSSKRIEPGSGELTISLLRDELDSFSVRLDRIEEEMEFFKRLRAPDEQGSTRQLPEPEAQDP